MTRHIKSALFIVLSMLATLSCRDKLVAPTNTSSSAIVIFDQASSFVRTHSAFLGIKNLNWDAISSRFRVNVFEGMPDESLYGLINSMLWELQDGHALLYYRNRDVTTWDYASGYPENFDRQLLESYYWKSSKRVGPFTVAVIDGVGYAYYASFADEIAENHMDELVDMVASTKGLIIDIRSNGGGDGANTTTILGRLTDREVYLGKQLVKSGPAPSDFTESRYVLRPSGSQKKYLNKKIVVLTNRGNASAAAFFAGYAKVLGNVMSVGDRTGGAGGVATSLQLGNGWQIVVSATVGIDANGNVIENGIEPDIKVDQTAVDSMNHRDSILEAALAQF